MPIDTAAPRTLWALVTVSAALIASLTTFQASARTHLLDMLLTGAICGNPAQSTMPTLLSHCAVCWVSSVGAGLITLSVIALLSARPGPRRLPRTDRGLRRMAPT